MSHSKLSHDDRQRLFEELNRLPHWVDGGVIGEKGVLRAAGFPDNLVNSIILTGNSTIDTPNLFSHLKNCGHLTNRPTHTALGALVDHLLEITPHVEGKIFLAYLIKQYDMIDSKFQQTLQEQYGLFELSDAKTLLDLGWQTEHPEFSWQGPMDREELERIWSLRAQFLDAVFLEKGAQVARAVCRVESPDGGLGTGFAIGSNLVLTNQHVVPTDAMAKETVVRFGYRVDASGQLQEGQTYTIKQAKKRSPAHELDYVVLETEAKPGEDEHIGYLKHVNKTLQIGKPAFILQHPSGEAQKIVLQDNRITYVAPDHRRVQYLTNTEGGSSGSPVCNEQWDVVALHHSGRAYPQTVKTQHTRGNEGIPMMAILPEIVDLLSD